MAKIPAKAVSMERDKSGRQRKKSTVTRDTILDAALACFIEIGYANTTTAKIADRAQVSRGAMLHHFPAKPELIQAAVVHLHGKLMEIYDSNIANIPHQLSVEQRNRRGLEQYWKYLSSDLFTAYHELRVAGRTDRELQSCLDTSAKAFDDSVRAANQRLFPDWVGRGESYEMAQDVTRYLMEGMAVSKLVRQQDKRVERVLKYAGDLLQEIYDKGDPRATIHHHAAKS